MGVLYTDRVKYNLTKVKWYSSDEDIDGRFEILTDENNNLVEVRILVERDYLYEKYVVLGDEVVTLLYELSKVNIEASRIFEHENGEKVRDEDIKVTVNTEVVE